MKNNTTIDVSEVEKFAQHATQWWDQEGPLKTLHDINPTRLAFIKKYVDLKGLRVLDVGCGGGILAEAMAFEGAQVTGLDVEVHVIEAARAHAKEAGLVVEYCCEPVDTFSAPLFDGITCLEMLEHVPDPSLVIQALARLVKPGGYLFLSTLNRTVKAYLMAIVAAEYLLSLLPRQTHDYQKFIKPSELAAVVRAAGFEVVSLEGLSYSPLTRSAALCKAVDVNYLMCARRLP